MCDPMKPAPPVTTIRMRAAGFGLAKHSPVAGKAARRRIVRQLVLGGLTAVCYTETGATGGRSVRRQDDRHRIDAVDCEVAAFDVAVARPQREDQRDDLEHDVRPDDVPDDDSDRGEQLLPQLRRWTDSGHEKMPCTETADVFLSPLRYSIMSGLRRGRPQAAHQTGHTVRVQHAEGVVDPLHQCRLVQFVQREPDHDRREPPVSIAPKPST